ncbi:hypothetical protein H1S01_10820 [Heliobacterium chlorum]|uniref:Uncharacterized protein n=1 Tax=Heliobacterium chlorum TaxID=2698 RepID=A0ABR7T628_HELCL|nr:hypothetical protein [Heliobacterium chlorum]MBC9785001.1 hypothetical protein [Heliobacterium chlorum]
MHDYGLFSGLLGSIMGLLGIVIAIVPFWKIFSKAGFSPWYSLLLIIPIVNIIVLFVLAFADWPALRQQKQPYEFGPQ